jgi:uncharacterized membrane protein
MWRKCSVCLFGLSLVLAVTAKSLASGLTFTTIDYPGAVGTIATGINFKGTIVGDFCSTDCTPHERAHGYILSQGTFTQFDFPDSDFTRPLGINDAGKIVGFYREVASGLDHGFLLSGGSFTSIDFPGASQTHAIGIDLAGDIFGGYCHGGNSCYFPGESVHGFLLSKGVFTTIDFPGAIFTEVWGHDRTGQIAGRYQDARGVFHIFLLSNGSFTSIDFPGAAETAPGWYAQAGGINAVGNIASGYCAAEPCLNPSSSAHGFLLIGGSYTTIDFPGGAGTIALGVNSSDEVVGFYGDSSGAPHGFLRTP